MLKSGDVIAPGGEDVPFNSHRCDTHCPPDCGRAPARLAGARCGTARLAIGRPGADRVRRIGARGRRHRRLHVPARRARGDLRARQHRRHEAGAGGSGSRAAGWRGAQAAHPGRGRPLKGLGGDAHRRAFHRPRQGALPLRRRQFRRGAGGEPRLARAPGDHDRHRPRLVAADDRGVPPPLLPRLQRHLDFDGRRRALSGRAAEEKRLEAAGLHRPRLRLRPRRLARLGSGAGRHRRQVRDGRPPLAAPLRAGLHGAHRRTRGGQAGRDRHRAMGRRLHRLPQAGAVGRAA